MNVDLKQTYYCDYDHPSIKRVAKQLETDNPTMFAMDSYMYVRDGIPFGFDLFQTRASQTLERGYGVCWNKALLLVALLRSNGIPARFGSIPVNKSFVAPAVGKVHLLINNPYNHCVASVYIDNRWIVLDPVLDRKSYDAFYRPLNVEWGINWDGINDCQVYTESVLGLPVWYDDIDMTLNKKVGNIEYHPFLSKPLNAWINRGMWKRTGNNPI